MYTSITHPVIGIIFLTVLPPLVVYGIYALIKYRKK